MRACARARAVESDEARMIRSLISAFSFQEGRRRSLADWRCSRASVQRELIVDSGRTRSFREASALSSMVCVYVCVRVPRFRLRPHQDTTRTGRVYGPAHCIWSQKCHTDAPHALPPRSRTPPAIEISGGKGWKRKGVGEGVWVCLYSVSVRLMTTCRGCSRRERDEDEIRSCLRSSLIEKLG